MSTLIKMQFDPEVAKEVGTDSAIILSNIEFWTAKNKANGRNFHDGNYWTYNSISAFKEQFNYLTESQIRRCLKKLEDYEYIGVGNYNKSNYDRTKWYCSKRQVHLTFLTNGSNETVKPIPDNKPNTKPNTIDSYNLLDIQIEDVPEKEKQYFRIAKGLLNFFIEHRKYRGLVVQKYLLEAKYSSYVNPIRLLVESDGYSLEDVKETARYLISDKVDDHFYKDVVLSTDKFRKQFENIQIKRMKYLKKLELKKQNDKRGMV